MVQQGWSGQRFRRLGSFPRRLGRSPAGFSLEVQRQGAVAFVDPQAKICWPENLYPQIKSGLTLGSLMGPGSGESFQLAFHGPGFVVVQPSERQPVMTWS
nr:AIM24 family protein [Actinomyces oris]